MMRERGFSLIEALIAATLVVVALAGLAQLFVIAMSANQRAKSRTVATILAQEKMEELTAIDHAAGAGSDFLDAQGNLLGAGEVPPPGTLYVRRWSSRPLPSHPASSVLEVSVALSRDVPGGEAVRLVSVKPGRIPWR